MKKYERIYLFKKVPFDRIKKGELIKEIVGFAGDGKKKLVLNMNAYGVVNYLENKNYARVIDKADIIYPDGWGPVFASKYMENSLSERVNVGDFIDDLLKNLAKNKRRLYLLGSEESLVKKTAEAVNKKYKGLKLVGYRNGYFSKRQTGEVVGGIKKSKPDIVLVGMGLPKQEFFIDRNRKGLPSAVYMGIGGAFNYIAKTKSRAPVWMRENGLEWLYRFIQEPVRLGKRYTLDNIKFVYYLIKFLVINSV